MSLHRNRVQMTVTSVDGVTGELTLGSATTGYQSFSSAYGANATVDILITEGTDWEVDRNCSYNHANGLVDRGTIEASSSGGSTVTFTTPTVSVIATAASGNNWGLNQIKAAVTGSNVTGVVGTMHILDLAGLTADRDFVLPAACAVGDRIGVFVEVGDADHELLLKPDSIDTINGGSAGAEWSRLFISNECVIFRCITANSAWIVEHDGRIPCTARMGLESTITNRFAVAGTYYEVAFDSVQYDNASMASIANEDFTIRRAGKYLVQASVVSSDATADQEALTTRVMIGGATTAVSRAFRASGAASFSPYGTVDAILEFASGDVVSWEARYGTTANLDEHGQAGGTTNYMSLRELIP
jgi:hypothetical protein